MDSFIPCTRTFEVQIRRDTRWDIYPQQEPVETLTVRVTRGAALPDDRLAACWAALLADRKQLVSAILDSMPYYLQGHHVVDFKEVTL